ncbi:MAG: hypothetical protein WC851_05235 [Candidatus Shapirobacteria bacterium]|jgi:RimK family alpha-L-glutamate ligase
MKNKTKIALFFGGKISQHLVMIRKAAKKLGVDLDLVSYNRVCFDSEEKRVKIRGNLGRWGSSEEWINLGDYDVLFFRTTGKHWEEVDLVVREVKRMEGKKPVIVDPIILNGKPSMACKAYQMLALGEAGIDVPRSIYGSLWYLFEFMKEGNISNTFSFPVIIKGSGGDRGTRVYKADNLEELETLVRELRKTETEEGKRYMLQEFIPNDGDFRVLVLGKKVLGVMKRSSQNKEEFRNNYSAGGKVEVADLPEEIKQLAVKAAEVCGLAVAGVDVAFRNNDRSKPVIWEVNKGPQFKGFMASTGIDVPSEIIKYLVSLKNENFR